MNSKNKPNGHGALLAKGSGANGSTISLSGMGRAASVDASELSVANAAPEPVPGLEPLPIDGEAFVDAVHTQVDLVQLEVDLLSSTDDKIVQRELAYLRELRYGKRAAPAGDEMPQIIVDMPGPGEDNTP